MRKRILVLTDQPLVALGLSKVVKEVEPSGHVHHVVSTPHLMDRHDARWDLLVVDLDTKGSRRLSLVKRLLWLLPKASVIALSSAPRSNEVDVAQAMGVAYLDKSSPTETLRQAVADAFKHRL